MSSPSKRYAPARSSGKIHWTMPQESSKRIANRPWVLQAYSTSTLLLMDGTLSNQSSTSSSNQLSRVKVNTLVNYSGTISPSRYVYASPSTTDYKGSTAQWDDSKPRLFCNSNGAVGVCCSHPKPGDKVVQSPHSDVSLIFRHVGSSASVIGPRRGRQAVEGMGGSNQPAHEDNFCIQRTGIRRAWFLLISSGALSS